MGVESEAFFEVQKLVRGWSGRNQELLPLEVKKKRIGVTQSLEGSFADRVTTRETTVIAEQVFDDSGRFVDMRVGRGAPLGSPKGRKTKKWMRLMFARLNALEGAVGIKVMEGAVNAVKAVKG